VLSNRVQSFFDELFIKYVLHTNTSQVNTLNFSAFARSLMVCPIKSVLLSDEKGPVIITFNAEDGLDLDAITTMTSRTLALDSGQKYKRQLEGFSIRHLPPLGRFFQIPMVMDSGLLNHEKYLIEINSGESFIEIDQKGFKQLFQGAVKKQFTKPKPGKRQAREKQSAPPTPRPRTEVVSMTQQTNTLLTLSKLESDFDSGVNLPVIPSVANQLIDLKSKNDFELLDLVYLIESDPVVSAKIIAYANSPFFSYEGKLASVQEAVYHVLGIDLSLNISLALALGQQFKGPSNGPLGSNAIWRHAVYCAVLSQSIASKISSDFKVSPGSAYLFGLLHNIGFLTLGHVYSDQFKAFNKMVIKKQNVPYEMLEKSLLGVQHVNVGAKLMEAWNMPEQYPIVVGNHHKVDYEGKHQVYVNIVYLANVLLKSVEIGDSTAEELPQELLEKYGLKESELINMLNIVMEWHEKLDNLAHQLAA